MMPADWCAFTIALYQVALMWLSAYPANSMREIRIVVWGVLAYFLVRLVRLNTPQLGGICCVVSLGGAVLAWPALGQFRAHAEMLREAGITDVVALRSRLITPPFVLGEWLTVVLLTLPFALAAVVWLATGERRRGFAVVAAAPVLVVLTVICLACSRAVFWSVVVLMISGGCLVALFGAARARLTAVTVSGALVSLACVVFAANAVYPGVLNAYVGTHVSQTRSTEGRLSIWVRALNIVREHPVSGVGPANAPLYLGSEGEAEESAGFASRTFSLPLQIAAEQGVVGLVLFGSFLGTVSAAFGLSMRRAGLQPAMRAMMCVLFGGVVAVCVRELAYSSLPEQPAAAILFGALAGLVIWE